MMGENMALREGLRMMNISRGLEGFGLCNTVLTHRISTLLLLPLSSWPSPPPPTFAGAYDHHLTLIAASPCFNRKREGTVGH